MGRGGGIVHSWFLPPSIHVVVSVSVCFSYCEMLPYNLKAVHTRRRIRPSHYLPNPLCSVLPLKPYYTTLQFFPISPGSAALLGITPPITTSSPTSCRLPTPIAPEIPTPIRPRQGLTDIYSSIVIKITLGGQLLFVASLLPKS